MLELDERVVRAEQVLQALRRVVRGVDSVAIDQPTDLARAAAAQHDQSDGVSSEVRWIERRWPRVVRRQVRRGGLPRPGALVGQGDQAAQVGVALLALGEQRQVDGSAVFVDQAVRQGQLDADDRLHASHGARLGELHRTVQPVMVGNGERAIAEIRRARR